MLDQLSKDLTWSTLLLFALFALPGFISLSVWSRISPTPDRAFKDQFGEAIAFGMINAAVVAPLLATWSPDSFWKVYVGFLASLTILPVCWPFALRAAIGLFQKYNILLVPSRNAWDDVLTCH